MKWTVGLGVVLVLMIGAAFAYRWSLVSEYRVPVLSQLKDPDSAQFRNEIVISPWGLANSVLCGEVNAKNSMGGYVGYRSFDVYVDSDSGAKKVNFYTSGGPACELMKNDVPWWWIRW